MNFDSEKEIKTSHSISEIQEEEGNIKKQITQIKIKINQQFGISDGSQYYVSMPKKDLNPFLFFMLGSIQTAQSQQSELFKKIFSKNKIKIVLKDIFSHQIKKQYLKMSIIQRFHQIADNFNQHSNILQKNIEFWDKITPKSLSQNYKYIYFKLQKIQSWQNIESQGRKNVLISFLDEDQENIILYVFQTQKCFEKQGLDRILFQDIKVELKKQDKRDKQDRQYQQDKQSILNGQNKQILDEVKELNEQQGKIKKQPFKNNKQTQNIQNLVNIVNPSWFQRLKDYKDWGISILMVLVGFIFLFSWKSEYNEGQQNSEYNMFEQIVVIYAKCIKKSIQWLF